MSYWVYLTESGETDDEMSPVLAVERHSEGGTYAVGGTAEACLNVTYNYAGEFHRAWTDVGGTFDDSGDSSTLAAMIGSKRAGDVADIIQKAVDLLGTERDSDYWKPTPGNAGYALSLLLQWARQYPDGVFVVH